jgi:hypothetical protein
MKTPQLEPRVIGALRMAPLTRFQIARMCSTDVSNVNKVIANLVMDGSVTHDGFVQGNCRMAQRFRLV